MTPSPSLHPATRTKRTKSSTRLPVCCTVHAITTEVGSIGAADAAVDCRAGAGRALPGAGVCPLRRRSSKSSIPSAAAGTSRGTLTGEPDAGRTRCCGWRSPSRWCCDRPRCICHLPLLRDLLGAAPLTGPGLLVVAGMPPLGYDAVRLDRPPCPGRRRTVSAPAAARTMCHRENPWAATLSQRITSPGRTGGCCGGRYPRCAAHPRGRCG